MASFEELQALAEVVSKNKVKHIHVIGNAESANTKFDQFYDALASGRLENDKQAAQFLYQASPDHAAYRKLKDRLQDRLVNTLFFVDVNQENFNPHNRAYYSLYKEVAAAKMLIGLNTRSAAIPIAEKALRSVMKFEFVDLILSLAKDLRLHYGTITGERKKFEEMDEIVEKYTTVLCSEIKGEKYFADIICYYTNTRATNLEIKDKVDEYANELTHIKVKENISSPRFNFCTYIILTLQYEVVNDHANTLKMSEQALAYFEKIEERVPISYPFIFALKILICLVYLKNFESAKIAMVKCLRFSREGTYNWFLTYEYSITAAFHSKNFQDAYLFYEKAVNHNKFRKQPLNIIERWTIVEAYIYYLSLNKKLNFSDEDDLKKFRLNRFLNEVPLYSKDKRGANISILILQILFYYSKKIQCHH